MLSNQTKARVVGGSRVTAKGRRNPLGDISSRINKILDDKQYQSVRLNGLNAAAFYTTNDEHKKLVSPTARISSRASLLVLTGALDELPADNTGNRPVPTQAIPAKKLENKYFKRVHDELRKSKITVETVTTFNGVSISVQNTQHSEWMTVNPII